MPFKTKNRKVAAKNRHFVNFNDNVIVSYSGGKQSAMRTKHSHDSESGKVSRTIEADYSFVKRELRKITLLATLIIGLQIALKLSHLSFLG